MKKITLLLTALLLSPALLALRPAGTTVKFAPADGTSLTKTFENKSSLTLEEYTMTGAGAAPDMEMTLTTSQKVTITDDYVTVKGGSPKKLVRLYDELAGDSSMAMKMSVMGQTHDNTQNMRMKSELEGKKVVFTWDAEKEAYTKKLDPDEDKPKLLKDLSEDMDFRSLLPDKEVAEADEWEVPMKGLREVFSPGGGLSMVPETSDSSSMQLGSEMSSMSNMIGDKLEGSAKAKLASLKEVDGRNCAVIQVTLDVRSDADMTEAARKMIEEGEMPPGVDELEIDHLDIEFRFEGEGELVWDLAAGHFKSFTLSGQASIKSDQGVKLSAAGRKMEISETRKMSGTTSYSASAK
ncbi:MAG: hypothetical protein JNL28_15615 [Planctomycetes bacterium]|nr:hypothetical protein [Planctomycetota bacterium]